MVELFDFRFFPKINAVLAFLWFHKLNTVTSEDVTPFLIGNKASHKVLLKMMAKTN